MLKTNDKNINQATFNDNEVLLKTQLVPCESVK
jgi:hypothetical protein